MAHMEFNWETALGYEQFSLSTTNPKMLTIPQGSSVAVVQVQGNTARVRFDTQVPTRDTGYRILADQTVEMSNGCAREARFIADGGSSPIVSVHYY